MKQRETQTIGCSTWGKRSGGAAHSRRGDTEVMLDSGKVGDLDPCATPGYLYFVDVLPTSGLY